MCKIFLLRIEPEHLSHPALKQEGSEVRDLLFSMQSGKRNQFAKSSCRLAGKRQVRMVLRSFSSRAFLA